MRMTRPTASAAPSSLFFPEVVSDHYDLSCAAPFIGFQQRASHQRRNARQRKGRGGHAGDGLRLTGAGADGDVAFFHLDGAKIGDRAETVAPQLVITARCGDRRIVGDIPVPQCNDRGAVRKRNRRPERLSRDLEPDGADGDRERHGSRCDHGERRMLDQHATAEPEVEHREAQTAEGAQIHVKAKLRLHVVVQRVASAKGSQKRADSCKKRQHNCLLLIQSGEGRLPAFGGQGLVNGYMEEYGARGSVRAVRGYVGKVLLDLDKCRVRSEQIDLFGIAFDKVSYGLSKHSAHQNVRVQDERFMGPFPFSLAYTCKLRPRIRELGR